MTSKLLQDKVVFITGGGQGIGLECAKAYADEGAKVAIADISMEKAEQSASQLPGDALALHCDVGESAVSRGCHQAALNHYGRLDVVHNNAGICQPVQAAARDQRRRVGRRCIASTSRASI